MRDANSLHQRLQHYGACFLESDPGEELRDISSRGIGAETTEDVTELALKYLSLSILAAIASRARDVRILRTGDMEGTCLMDGQREITLPKPPTGVAREMVGVVRRITGLEPDEGTARLIYGLNNDELEIGISVSRWGDRECMSLSIPVHGPTASA